MSSRGEDAADVTLRAGGGVGCGRGPGQVAEHGTGEDQEEAERRGMHGSPTLLIDGLDPFAVPGTPASVSCRLYRSPDGRVDGAPSVDDLRQALGAMAASG